MNNKKLINKNDVIDYPSLKPYKKPTSKYFYVSFHINGRLQSKSTREEHCPDRAHTKARDIYKEAFEGSKTELKGKVISLKDATDNFIQCRQNQKRLDNNKSKTIANYISLVHRMNGYRVINNKTIKVTGLVHPDTLIHDITQSDVDKFIFSIENSVAPSTAKAMCQKLRIIFDFFLFEDTNIRKTLYAFNNLTIPTNKASPATGKKKFKAPPKKELTVTPEQKEGILDYLINSPNPENYVAALGLMVLPLRIGEWFSCTWDSINLETKKIQTNRSKGSEDGTVTIPERLVKALKQQYKKTGNTPYVFYTPRSATGYKSHSNNRWFRKAVESLPDNPNNPKLVEKRKGKQKVTPHTLRHTLATELAEILTPVELTLHFGWSSVQMAERYTHNKKKDVTADKAAQHMDNIMK